MPVLRAQILPRGILHHSHELKHFCFGTTSKLAVDYDNASYAVVKKSKANIIFE